ncbi:MAG: N-acetylmuramoyl-L-alanine amidase [Clostridia bacterium]|nr:N-acetylmuramoyl-L-alanine amidase [Clostridia bacterium]
MKLRLLNFLIIIIIILGVFNSVVLADDIKLFLDGNPISCDVPPTIINDRTMVPVRAFLEALDARVSWNDEKKQVTARTDDTKIILVIGSNVAYVNSVLKSLDSPPVIVNSRTLVPVRFISESLGYEVRWVEKSRSVFIKTPKNTEPEKDENTNADTAAPAETNITSMVYSVSGNSFVMKFTFSSPLSGYSLYNLDNPVRTVLELGGASYSGSKTITVESGGIKQIRTANHDSYYKVVADLEDVLDKKFTLASNKLSATLTLTASSAIDSSDIESDLPSTNKPSYEEESIEIIYDKYWEVTDQSIVVLDAGHGGTDVGAIGYNEDGEKVFYEKDLNLTVTLEVARILKEHGVNVLLTRSDDSSLALSQRYTFSNANNALLFVSIHHNSHATSTPSGALTLFSEDKDVKYPNLKSSESIAETIQKHLTEATGLYDGGTRSEDELAVLRGTETSAVLIEVAFVSNYDDQEFLLDEENLNKAAAGIAAGILEVLED